MDKDHNNSGFLSPSTQELLDDNSTNELLEELHDNKKYLSVLDYHSLHESVHEEKE